MGSWVKIIYEMPPKGGMYLVKLKGVKGEHELNYHPLSKYNVSEWKENVTHWYDDDPFINNLIIHDFIADIKSDLNIIELMLEGNILTMWQRNALLSMKKDKEILLKKYNRIRK